MPLLWIINFHPRSMKAAAIGIVILIVCIAFYANDRITTQRKTLHLADSLDSISSGALHYSVDSLMNTTDKRLNARIIQLNKRIRFQDGVIIRLQDRLDSLIIAQKHGR